MHYVVDRLRVTHAKQKQIYNVNAIFIPFSNHIPYTKVVTWFLKKNTKNADFQKLLAIFTRGL